MDRSIEEECEGCQANLCVYTNTASNPCPCSTCIVKVICEGSVHCDPFNEWADTKRKTEDIRNRQ